MCEILVECLLKELGKLRIAVGTGLVDFSEALGEKRFGGGKQGFNLSEGSGN